MRFRRIGIRFFVSERTPIPELKTTRKDQTELFPIFNVCDLIICTCVNILQLFVYKKGCSIQCKTKKIIVRIKLEQRFLHEHLQLLSGFLLVSMRFDSRCGRQLSPFPLSLGSLSVSQLINNFKFMGLINCDLELGL